MHELSIISSVVDSVMETQESYPDARQVEVRLRVGVLAAADHNEVLVARTGMGANRVIPTQIGEQLPRFLLLVIC